MALETRSGVIPLCPNKYTAAINAAKTALIAAINRVNSLLEMEPLMDSNGVADVEDSSVVLDRVSFRYSGAERNALSNLSLTIPAGSKVALVGPSGGGKSTAAQLIARFFDVTDGSIKLGGVSVGKIPQEKLAGLISFVFQNSMLLKTSILENIRLNPYGQRILNDVSFTAKQGEVTALIGPSGSGKTTVSRLAARFWDIDLIGEWRWQVSG